MFVFSVLVTVATWIIVGTSTIADTGSREDICICTLEYLPICASDLNTYANDCNLQCAKLQNPGLQAVCPGPCPCSAEDEHTVTSSFTLQQQTESEQYNTTGNVPEENHESGCNCPKILLPVCGSNGVTNFTYPNECFLQCDQRQGNITDIVKLGDGEC